MYLNIVLRSTALILLLVTVGCSTVPITGRKSLSLLPESQLAQMSLASYGEVLKNSELSQDPAQIAQVRRVGERLAGATESYLRANNISYPPFAWEFNVIKEDDTANAFAMPGGKIAVYTGLFPVAQSDTGLAVVMSHEIAHVIAKHGNERMSQSMIAQFGSTALSVALRDSPGLTQQIFMTSYGATAQVGLLLPFSRLHESEADRIGIVLMAIAGYDPRESVRFWQRMSDNSSGGRPPQLLSTHPDPQRRVQRLQESMSEAVKIYNNQQNKT